MKIPLNIGQNGATSKKEAQDKMLENDILRIQKGDWEAKKNLIRTFSTLINSLAEKRSDKPVKINEYVEAGKNGLITAVKKYNIKGGAHGFQLFALDFIEEAMNRVDKGGGFFARLFGKG